MNIAETLHKLAQENNLRTLPHISDGVIDLSSNDYLGLAADASLRQRLLLKAAEMDLALSSSASRLLAADQQQYSLFETRLAQLYGRDALLFNSGYHANTGMISALAERNTLILADKLVHASIIDGVRLSGAQMQRFPHNNFDRLENILADKAHDYETVLIVAESVYSMDGDKADIDRLIAIKKQYKNALLYIDEAHAVGVEGPAGLGLVQASSAPSEVDVMVGTFGKALGSVGAYAIVDSTLKQFFINRARSFIFSTSLPPLNIALSAMLFEYMLDMDTERAHLKKLANKLQSVLNSAVAGHIQPYIVGDAAKALTLSARLLDAGLKVLPIRTPTVPPGTERLRFSLSAATTDGEMAKVANIVQNILS